MEALTLTGSVVLLAAAGLCEIAGGYVVWLRVQDHRAAWLGALGGLNLFLYGILSTLQLETASFGRVTVYGSVCVAMSLAQGWTLDELRPDRYDLIGGAIALVCVAAIM